MTTRFHRRLPFRKPSLPVSRYWWLLICTAIALGAVSCKHHVPEGAAIEARIIEEEGCSDCDPVRFRNAYSNEESVLVRAEPDLVLSAESIARVNMLRFDNQIEGRIDWKAEILLTAEARKRALRFRADLGSTRKLLLISMAEQPIDVITSGELGGPIRVGSFDSIESFRSFFPTASPEEISVVLERSAQFNEMSALFEAATERTDSFIETFDALLEALDAGDEEEAERLESELTKQENSIRDVVE